MQVKKALRFTVIISNVNSAGENYDSGCFATEKNKKRPTEKWTGKITRQEHHNTINLSGNSVGILGDKSNRLILDAHKYI